MRVASQKIKNGFMIFVWGLYDLANQFFALNIVSLYFVRWITMEKGAPEIYYSVAFGISTFFIAALGTLLGVVSDLVNRRRPFLVYLTLLSIVFTMILGASDNIFVGLAFFVVANFGCQTATIFYNSLMINITPKNRVGLVSGIGKMMGYSGAIIALYLIKPIVLKSGYRATFLPTGILFLIFALPCLVFIKDQGQPQARIGLLSFFKKERIVEIVNNLKKTVFDSRSLPGLADFLKATFFGFCAINIIILFMSVYASRAFGLSEAQIINLITFSTFFAILGSIVSGYISDRVGARISLIVVFILWIACLTLGALVRDLTYYWLVGSMVGAVLGATWVVSRALAIELVPAEKIAEVFGLFNFVGYLSAIVGSLFWGLILLFLSPYAAAGYRNALFTLNIFMLAGLIFLLRIPRQLVKAN